MKSYHIEAIMAAVIIMILISIIVFREPTKYRITAPDLGIYGTNDYTIINNNNNSCIKFKANGNDIMLCGTYQIIKGK